METLAEIYSRHCVAEDTGSGDKGTVHSYIPVYEKLLAPYRDKPINFMEIGLARGLSLQMWSEYFSKASIIGVDISVQLHRGIYGEGEVFILQADATKPGFLKSLEGRDFDVVIDDASHQEKDQIATFNILQGRMKPGGLYIIEDILGLEQSRPQFEKLHSPVEIHDLRKQKSRFDDVLVVYRF